MTKHKAPMATTSLRYNIYTNFFTDETYYSAIPDVINPGGRNIPTGRNKEYK